MLNQFEKIEHYSRFILSVLHKNNEVINNFDLTDSDYWHIFRLASTNRVLFHFCNLIVNSKARLTPRAEKLCLEIIEHGNGKINILKNTLEQVFTSFDKNNIPYLITKTLWHYPCIPNDIDLLVLPERYDEAVSIMSNLKSIDLKHWITDDEKDVFEAEDFYKVELHKKFSWMITKKPFLDQELAWEGAEKRDYFGLSCPVPNPTFDWIANALNIMFERFYVTINIFYTLTGSKNSIDWNIVKQQAIKYNWFNTLNHFLRHLDNIGTKLEINNFKFSLFCKLKSNENDKLISFPYHFPVLEILLSYWEQLYNRGVIDYKLMPYNLTYARLKNFLSKGELVGIYGDWFPFSKKKSLY